MNIDKFLCFLTLLFMPISLLSESRFQSYLEPTRGFSLEYPQELTPVLSPEPRVNLALRHQNGFPTFNIISQPGRLLPMPGKSLCEQLVIDYHSVGLTDASLSGSEVPSDNSQIRQICKISYSRQQQVMYAWIAVVEQDGAHFILTLLDQQQELKPDLRHIFSSFRLNTTVGSGTNPVAGSPVLWLTLIVSVLIILIVVYFLVRKGHS